MFLIFFDSIKIQDICNFISGDCKILLISLNEIDHNVKLDIFQSLIDISYI